MSKFRTGAWISIFVFVVPALVAAQSLGDAAAKEKEKKKDTKPVKVYTEDDLKRAGNGSSGAYSAPDGPAASTDPSPKPDAAKTGGAPVKTDDEIKAEKQTAWKQKLDKAQADAAAVQKTIDDIQASLSANTSYYDPSRARAAADLDAAKAKLVTAQQSVSDLEDEGRRNGFH